MSARPEPLTPELLLQAYARGYFPMADSADDPGFFWVYPTRRGILPLDHFHVPHKLARKVRAGLANSPTCTKPLPKPGIGIVADSC